MSRLFAFRAVFDADACNKFMAPISGHGGGQRFVRSCQGQMVVGDGKFYVPLTKEGRAKWIRYRDQYGPGGFQQRLKLGKLDG